MNATTSSLADPDTPESDAHVVECRWQYERVEVRRRELLQEQAEVNAQLHEAAPGSIAPVSPDAEMQRILDGAARPAKRSGPERDQLGARLAAINADLGTLHIASGKAFNRLNNARLEAARKRVQREDVVAALLRVSKAAELLATENTRLRALLDELQGKGFTHFIDASTFGGLPFPMGSLEGWRLDAESLCKSTLR